MDTRVVEVTDLNSEVRCDLRGCLEAAMASEAIKMAVRGNMHMDARVVEVTEFNSEVRCDRHGLRGNQNGCKRQYAHCYQGNQGCWFKI